MELTTKQKEGFDLLYKFITGKYNNKAHPGVFILDGFAGTGKSTLLSKFISTVQTSYRCAIITYTGKASQVLAKKGLPRAQTIHSYLYNCTENSKGELEYELKDRIFFNEDFVIVDESSFIDDNIYNDLCSRCKKIIFIGDSFQLSLNRTSILDVVDFRLDEVLRFQGEILDLAEKVRVNNYVPKAEWVDWSEVANYDILICYKNNTRQLLNLGYRRNILGKTGYVSKGEKIMFLTNTKDIYLGEDLIMNGTITELDADPIPRFYTNFVCFYYKNIYFHFGEKPMFIHKGQISPRKLSDFDIRVLPVTYAYAITCHKSQGSEWDNVLLVNESKDPHYTYTGITRAKDKIKVIFGVKKPQ